MEAIKKSGVRGDEGIKTLTYDYNGRDPGGSSKWSGKCG